MLAAGGTGGHLFPAFALAEELGRRGWDIELVTDMRGDRYGTGFPARAVHRVHSATLKGRGLLAMARTGFTLMRGVREAYRLLGRSGPAAVVGFGGYPSFPPIAAARLRGIPTLLHEQNAVMGRANRMLAKRVSAIATSFERTALLPGDAQARSRTTGNPVREAVIAASREAYRPPAADGPFEVVVFGGSQGARVFSETVPEALAFLPEPLRRRLRVVQQCREEDVSRVREAYARAGIDADLATFFTDLPQRMAAAHLVVARAGASTVAELSVLGRPSILVPLPHSLDNDQLQNATRLAESGGCWCIEQRDLNAERLVADIRDLMNNPDRLVAAAEAARHGGKPDAVIRLADFVEEVSRASVRSPPNRAKE